MMHQRRHTDLIHGDSKRQLMKIIIAAALLGILLAFIAGRYSVGDLLDLSAENDVLQQRVEALTESNKQLLKQQDFVVSGKKVDLLAKQDARRVLTSLHDELSEVKEKLKFYQRIISPESLVKGPYIHGFEIMKDGGGSVLRYQLTLAQVSNKRAAVKGKVSFVIVGRQKNKPVTLEMKSITAEQKEAVSFSFRYYQLLSGALVLPKDFIPERVEVILKSSGKSSKPLQKHWLWNDVIDGDPA